MQSPTRPSVMPSGTTIWNGVQWLVVRVTIKPSPPPPGAHDTAP